MDGDPVEKSALKTAGAVGGGEVGVLAAGVAAAGTPVCIVGVALGSVLVGLGGEWAGA